jgi:hypothetical protein
MCANVGTVEELRAIWGQISAVYSKTLLIRRNWELTLVQLIKVRIIEVLLKIYVQGNFKLDFIWLGGGRQLYFETQILYHKINLLIVKCKIVSFDISLKRVYVVYVLNIIETMYKRLTPFGLCFPFHGVLLLHLADCGSVVSKVVICKENSCQNYQKIRISEVSLYLIHCWEKEKWRNKKQRIMIT